MIKHTPDSDPYAEIARLNRIAQRNCETAGEWYAAYVELEDRYEAERAALLKIAEAAKATCRELKAFYEGNPHGSLATAWCDLSESVAEWESL